MTLRRIGLLLLGAAGVILAAPVAPEQPIPFSHKVHAGNLKIQCKMCHPNPDPGEMMKIAEASVCMQCHSSVKTDSASIQKLAAFAKNDREIKWARVYQIPGFVNFSHRAHLDAKNTCQECHGQVASRDQLSRETDISMGGCMNCHRAKKASIDCAYCHELQN
ncbi:MAG: cytochrome c family protein [Acidobacteriota bacterium]|nr:cytochrome c family protein [Acidobacteriota bacterium]